MTEKKEHPVKVLLIMKTTLMPKLKVTVVGVDFFKVSHNLFLLHRTHLIYTDTYSLFLKICKGCIIHDYQPQ